MPIIKLQGKNSLATEQKLFEKKKAQLLRKYENKFVLIRKNNILGTYETAEEAYKDGLERIGNKPMFIRKVTKREPPPMLMGIL